MKTWVFFLTLLWTGIVFGREITGTVRNNVDGAPLPGVVVSIKNTTITTVTDDKGIYRINVPDRQIVLVFSVHGWVTKEVWITSETVLNVTLEEDFQALQEVIATGLSRVNINKSHKAKGETQFMADQAMGAQTPFPFVPTDPISTSEEYLGLQENKFKSSTEHPLSTFSIDVDVASYANMRRFINMGQKPPKEAIRIEEMINYFDYDFETPKKGIPVAIHTELTDAPWNKNHYLLQVALQGEKIEKDVLPASNLVFLIDVSGSMSDINKLPLLKSAFKLLIEELRPQDKVSLVVYAGAAGVVLAPTTASEKEKIFAALDHLQAGGSTAGGAGIQLAYETAKSNFILKGNNRVILATDGDFNVGVSSHEALENLIETKRKEGIYLTVLGFGMGNYKDARMELLADKGNGNYAYIDNLKEAKKVLVNEFSGTLFTIAKDVKIQIEFNPAKVAAYRLIGYENRILQAEDFNNDRIDAGEMGSGHTVTALYEIIPRGIHSKVWPGIDPLKYQKENHDQKDSKSDEYATVKFRYKLPHEETSHMIATVVNKKVEEPGEFLGWASVVAGFGMMLTESEYADEMTYEFLLDLGKKYLGKDVNGHRKECLELIELARVL